ncbi:MAG: hypothetical protein FWD55_05455 [Propionibacteriaceae bacterium]|nr:hypothetical protein [Propionibacteriaceae bacterium]
MKNDQIIAAWDTVNPDAGTRTRMLGNVLTSIEPSRRRTQKERWEPWKVLVPVGALAVILAIAAPMYLNGAQIPLTDSQGVTVTQVNRFPNSPTSLDLVPFTEEELLTGVDIFSAKVIRIETIKVQFSDSDTYMSVVTVQVNSVIRGDMAPGDQIKILIHPPVGALCSICEMSSQISRGSTAIFLATPSAEGYYATGDFSEVFYYSDVSEYYLFDPVRPLFIETSTGVLFNTWGWPTLAQQGSPTPQNGISQIASLEIVEDFIRSMI